MREIYVVDMPKLYANCQALLRKEGDPLQGSVAPLSVLPEPELPGRQASSASPRPTSLLELFSSAPGRLEGNVPQSCFNSILQDAHGEILHLALIRPHRLTKQHIFLLFAVITSTEKPSASSVAEKF